MAQKNQSSSKQRASGGGRTSNSEPRVQTFTQFGGCNFQLSPKDFRYSDPIDDAQSDLQMNLMVVQNNADITSNKTIETRQPLVHLYEAEDSKFNGTALMHDYNLYLATEGGNIAVCDVRDPNAGIVKQVNLRNNAGRTSTPEWTCLGWADDVLVGMDASGSPCIWTGDEDEPDSLANAKHVTDPSKMVFSDLKAKGDLAISETLSDECSFRIGLRLTHVNKFGPTLASPLLTFFANKPTTEWSGLAYLEVNGTIPKGYDIKAVELYYVEDEYQEANFLARVNVSDAAPQWTYNWVGYLADTSMWTTANITIPTQNYTDGVPASYMIQHDGRLYFWGNDKFPNRLWIGGNAGNIFSVSTGVGGGFTDVEPGSGQEIRMVPKYKTQSGNSIVTILCDNKNSSHEHRHNLLENNISLSSEQNVKGWQTEKINGTVGCKSPRGAGVWADGLYAISRYGLALTTMTMEYNSQLRVQYVSDPIEPVFLDQKGTQLRNSVLACVNDVIYMCFGRPEDSSDSHERYLDNVLFCYDIDLKAWWTYTLDVDDGESILNIINIDYEGSQEGIGIITNKNVFFLPTTRIGNPAKKGSVPFLIESGELATAIPSQNMQHLTQLEFRFDYFVGDARIELTCVDQFGRKLEVAKELHYDSMQRDLVEYMRVDLRVLSYKITLSGKASFRLTHFLAKTYPLPSKVGIVWGFDTSQGHRYNTDIHRTFRCYNDLKKAIIP